MSVSHLFLFQIKWWNLFVEECNIGLGMDFTFQKMQKCAASFVPELFDQIFSISVDMDRTNFDDLPYFQSDKNVFDYLYKRKNNKNKQNFL